MSRKYSLLAACVALALAGTPALANGNVNFSLGNRSLDNSDYEPVDEQTFIGATVDWSVSNWPVNLAAGLYRSTENDSIQGVDIEVTLTEVSFGAMYTWDVMGNMHPFTGAGLTYMQAEAEIGGPFNISEDDTGMGFYAEGGVYWRLGEMFNLGAQGRFNRGAKHSLGGEDIDSDYFQLGILAGFGFGNK